MTLQSKLIDFATRLYSAVTSAVPGFSAVYHHRRPDDLQTSPWIVWAEDAEEDSFYGSTKYEFQVHGWVDLYTSRDLDPLCDVIQNALDGMEHCRWRLNSVQYEDETGLIHYSWEWWYA